MEDVDVVDLPPWPADKKRQKTSNHTANHYVSKLVPKVEVVAASPDTPLQSPRTNDFYAFSDVSASFDLASLDCPSCKKPLQSPIYQCYNGHYACPSCNDSNTRKCSKCSKPTGKIRNLGLESIIKTLRIKCKFSNSGCEEILRHCGRKEHEMVCLYAPHMCPILECEFCGPLKDFLDHFTISHKARSLQFIASNSIRLSLGRHDIYVVLQVENKPMFLLHNKQEPIGNVVYLTSFCTPPTNSNVRWSFELNVYKGKSKLTLDSVAHSHEDLMVEAKSTDFLVIPAHFFDTHRNIDATSNIFDLCKKVDVEISMQTDWNGLKLRS